MIDLNKVTSFEWDKGNIDKSYKKHAITTKETEEIFLDGELLFLEDIKHSQVEKRFVAIGKTTEKRILFASFTIRENKIRIISVRTANQKERRKYEQKP